MKCSDWMDFFHDQEKVLAKQYPEWIDLTEPGDAADRFAEFQHATESSVEVAIRQFVTEEKWPAMTSHTGAMMRVRLIAAYEFVNSLQFAHLNFYFPLPAKHWARSRWIEWFLIEVWDGVGFGKIHGTLESLRRADSTDTPPPFRRN